MINYGGLEILHLTMHEVFIRASQNNKENGYAHKLDLLIILH